jgi:hypothetical protein
MKPSTKFTISRTGDGVPEFAVHEHCCYDYGRIEGVRACLTQHADALRQRLDALQEILATNDPERAERLLLESLETQVTEVELRPRRKPEAFETLMRTLFASET